MINDIKVKVRFYGMIADHVGFSEEDVNIPENSSINDLINLKYISKFQGKNLVSAYAINNRFSDKDNMIQNGDIIDLMPPFAGG